MLARLILTRTSNYESEFSELDWIQTSRGLLTPNDECLLGKYDDAVMKIPHRSQSEFNGLASSVLQQNLAQAACLLPKNAEPL